MRCFYHQDREAVGSCKSCGKGLCPDCAADVGKGLACRGRCEEDVRAVVALIDRNIKLSPQTTRLLESGRNSAFTLTLQFACFSVLARLALVLAARLVYGVNFGVMKNALPR